VRHISSFRWTTWQTDDDDADDDADDDEMQQRKKVGRGKLNERNWLCWEAKEVRLCAVVSSQAAFSPFSPRAPPLVRFVLIHRWGGKGDAHRQWIQPSICIPPKWDAAKGLILLKKKVGRTCSAPVIEYLYPFGGTSRRVSARWYFSRSKYEGAMMTRGCKAHTHLPGVACDQSVPVGLLGVSRTFPGRCVRGVSKFFKALLTIQGSTLASTVPHNLTGRWRPLPPRRRRSTCSRASSTPCP
jgi:hypothetical protein